MENQIEEPKTIDIGKEMSQDQNIPKTEPSLEQSPKTEVKPAVPPPASKRFPFKRFPKKVLIAIGGIFFVIVIFFLIRGIASRVQTQRGNEIVWWGISFDEAAVSSLISDYQTNNPNVTINYTKQSTKDYRERLTNAILRGQGPDIFEIHNTWVPMFYQSMDTIPSNTMSAADYSTTFYPIIASDMSVGSGFAGIPLAFDSLTLFINEEIFERESKTIPTTWDDVRRITQEMTKRDEEEVITQAGIAIGRTENVDHWQEILGLMFLQNGASLTKPDDVMSEGALNYFVSFSVEDEGVWDTTMPSSTQAFAAGKLAMYLAPGKNIDVIKNINPSLKFKTIPLPQVAKALPDQPDVSYATYWVQSVDAKSKKRNAAWEFLKFLTEKDSLLKLHEEQETFVGIYPRVDMLDLQLDDPFYGSIVELAPAAKTWYLQSNTNDGETGINTQVGSVYKVAIEGLNSRTTMKKTIELLVPEIDQVLRYFTIPE